MIWESWLFAAVGMVIGIIALLATQRRTLITLLVLVCFLGVGAFSVLMEMGNAIGPSTDVGPVPFEPDPFEPDPDWDTGEFPASSDSEFFEAGQEGQGIEPQEAQEINDVEELPMDFGARSPFPVPKLPLPEWLEEVEGAREPYSREEGFSWVPSGVTRGQIREEVLSLAEEKISTLNTLSKKQLNSLAASDDALANQAIKSNDEIVEIARHMVAGYNPAAPLEKFTEQERQDRILDQLKQQSETEELAKMRFNALMMAEFLHYLNLLKEQRTKEQEASKKEFGITSALEEQKRTVSKMAIDLEYLMEEDAKRRKEKSVSEGAVYEAQMPTAMDMMQTVIPEVQPKSKKPKVIEGIVMPMIAGTLATLLAGGLPGFFRKIGRSFKRGRRKPRKKEPPIRKILPPS